MDKKEISEIKKTFTIERCCITDIRGCLVNTEKEKAVNLKHQFMRLPEEEIHKYLAIFKKTLSGTTGKNLFNFEFAKDAEYKNGARQFLNALKGSALDDDNLVNMMFDRIINAYDYDDAYYIILAYGVYDIPDKNGGDSEYQYPHILCCICPMETPKAGLCYIRDEQNVRDTTFDRLVGAPDAAFLFPAFNDRNQDIHSLLYYSKKTAELHGRLIEALGCTIPISADMQKEHFQEIVDESFDNGIPFDAAMDIKAEISNRMEDDGKEISLNKKDIGEIIQAGSEEADTNAASDTFERLIGGNMELMAKNLINEKSTEIKGESFVLKVNASEPGIVDVKILDDGLKYIVIPVSGDVLVDGLPVRF